MWILIVIFAQSGFSVTGFHYQEWCEAAAARVQQSSRTLYPAQVRDAFCIRATQ